MKKYKLTKNTEEYLGRTLCQIEALKDFGDVKKGNKGGWIEKENNLSQDDNAWVSGDARVYGNARVSGDAWVYGNARVSGDAWVYGKLKLKGGYFYHYKEKTEQIEKIEIDEDYELLAKNPVLEEEDDTVEITVEGKTKRISRLSAKELNLL